jgi:cell division protein FtsI (penicillin-binding protein 3)
MRPVTPASVRSVNYATSPLLASKTPPWRSRFVVFLVGLAFVALLVRAVDLQILSTRFYQAQGAKRFVRQEVLPASRGRILDRNGLVLASSVAMPTVQVDTSSFHADATQEQGLAALLDMKAVELRQRLADGSGIVVLRRQVEESVWRQIQALDLPGVQAVQEYQRRYPEGEAAAQVVGFTDIDGKGQEGIELEFQSQLQGRPGERTVVRDRMGRVVEDVGDQAEPVNGHDVRLSIDSKVQFFAYQRLRDMVLAQGARSGSVVALDCQSGELLALANYPSYDPAHRVHLNPAQVRNRALTDIFEPGSTMKPFVVALGMDSGQFSPDTLVDTGNGRINITGSTITDTHPHGLISVAQVIQKSSNVGISKLAMQLTPHAMWDMYTAVGLGQKPRVDFPGAVTGRLRPYRSWRPIEQATMSYGYGLSVSLLQLAHAYTAIARDGELVPLSILDDPAADAAPVSGPRVMSAHAAQALRQMLQMAAGPGGTAPRAQVIGYSVAGKTGTVRRQEGRAYGDLYRSVFVGMAPKAQPRIVVAVMVDAPTHGVYFGGEVAAPVFSDVVLQTLRMMNVQPDLDVNAQISAKPVEAEPESL